MDHSSSFNDRAPGRLDNGKFLVVGIGASAGGIQALKKFFEFVPESSGIAYVVILHLSPNHDSKLAEVIRTSARIPVQQVTEKTKIAPDTIYVIPPNQHLTMEDDSILVSTNVQVEDRRAPIDIFFRTLAESHGSHAVCVILSGTGANGSMGLKRVKERGGAAFVQNPREAEFNEMPRNAISSDMVDAVLPVAEIPTRIINYKNNLGMVHIPLEAENRAETEQNALREIFAQLRARTGHDFANYKRPTLLRRIERRITVRSLPNLILYANYLQEHPDEVNALLKDLLISVTNFFRDKKAYEALESDVIPAILKNKKHEDQVRIWVAGCATGEEAYSIAMLCAEQTMNVIEAPKVQIFATDIDEDAIRHAREGFYTINDAADVSPERLRRFFNKEGDGYRIRREIREMVLFANHNFIKDPPFSHLDMVSCRNVLIYLNRAAQERVMETFHFALNTGGYLFLGTSESVDASTNLYDIVSRDHHVFKSRQTSLRAYPVPESVPAIRIDQLQTGTVGKEKSNRLLERITYGDLHLRLLEQYAPPSIVINEEYDIVHVSDRAAPYLQFTGGEVSQNLLKLVRQELRLELRSALYQALQQKTAVEAKGLRVKLEDRVETINMHVKPVLREDDIARGFILVLFERTEEDPGEREVILRSDEAVSRHLEEELMRLKAQLRSSNEQHEFQAEELKASNEELQAMNEELRSAAEELETSKEELQSMNEELRTVNQELKVKIEETSLTSNNLQNLINSANIGTIFLDRSFRVAMFTPAVREIFNLIPADYGRPLSDITHRLQYHGLLEDAENVLEKLMVIEREVDTLDGHNYIMRVLPYRTAEDHINGVVITFIDISSRKQAEQALRVSTERMEKAFSIETVGIIYFKISGEITGANDAFLQMCGYSRDDVQMGRLRWDEMTPAEFMADSLQKLEQFKTTGRITPYEKQYIRKDGSRFWALFSATRINEDEGVEYIIDITGQKQLEQQKEGFIAIASHELKTPVTSIKVYGEVLQEKLEQNGDKENFELIKKLNTQVDRLHNLIVDLLDTTNIVEGGLQLNMHRFDINELIVEQVEEMKRISANHVFKMKLDKLPLIKADRERIGQVLTNLLSNAVKYSPKASEITIVSNAIKNGIQVSVQDKGIGIPKNMISNIFDRFYRIVNPQIETYPGMGLGLYISAGIIERHGGTITVESTEGQGSTFYFTLPAGN
ncbi:CheR family methyltransferase [Longitalea arenae]|uniref:CheR family methyltransferase n=1 Tax=Longitalea arenae TaxID=2812558 RepID=UPI00196895D5|nr:CheR family methyltransferase [Longitalea arenae]